MLTSVLAFSISYPWRKEFFTNIPFLIVVVLAFAANCVICMVPGADWSEFKLDHLPTTNVRLYLLITSLGFSVFIYLLQKLVLEPISYKIVKKYHKIPWI